MARPPLNFVLSSGHTISKKERTEIEDVCSRAMKIIKVTKRLPWEERLNKWGLFNFRVK